MNKYVRPRKPYRLGDPCPPMFPPKEGHEPVVHSMEIIDPLLPSELEGPYVRPRKPYRLGDPCPPMFPPEEGGEPVVHSIELISHEPYEPIPDVEMSGIF